MRVTVDGGDVRAKPSRFVHAQRNGRSPELVHARRSRLAGPARRRVRERLIAPHPESISRKPRITERQAVQSEQGALAGGQRKLANVRAARPCDGEAQAGNVRRAVGEGDFRRADVLVRSGSSGRNGKATRGEREYQPTEPRSRHGAFVGVRAHSAIIESVSHTLVTYRLRSRAVDGEIPSVRATV